MEIDDVTLSTTGSPTSPPIILHRETLAFMFIV
jgi:hypothetical protein